MFEDAKRMSPATPASDPGDPMIKTVQVPIEIPSLDIPFLPFDTPDIHIGTVDVPVGFSGKAHSQYWDDGNEARGHIAHIVTGRYE